MGSYKIRQTVLLPGNFNMASGTTACFSGSMHMDGSASLSGTTRFGSAGTGVSLILSGSVSASVPQITASGGWVTGSLNIPGAALGAAVFLMPVNASAGMVAYQVSVCSLGNVSASFGNVLGATTGACDVTFRYFVIG
jgi:hypothetical protein